MITAKVICDSLASHGARLISLELEYPRFIHAEFMTHRNFSRSASGSRAIPVQKIIERIKNDPALPVFWGKNQKGMQANTELDFDSRIKAYNVWLAARDEAVKHAEELVAIGVHKQLVNRILEPWSHIQVIVTSTEWENFFNLRLHPDAQPEIQALARAMRDAIDKSFPERRAHYEWHLPYILPEEYEKIAWEKTVTGGDEIPLENAIKWSVARCARVSYNKHGTDKIDYHADEQLYEHLRKSGHMSPFEHQASPAEYANDGYGNFFGWRQFRKSLRGESIYKP